MKTERHKFVVQAWGNSVTGHYEWTDTKHGGSTFEEARIALNALGADDSAWMPETTERKLRILET